MATSTGHSRTSSSGSLDAKNPSSSNVHNVLKILNSRLGSDGNIKEAKDVAYVMVLMAEAVKLVDRCMFLNVIRATKSHSILRVMLEAGGWATLHTWLQQCRSEDGSAFLFELLHLYKHLPVSVELLRQNSCAKDIKQLMKSSDAKIASLAKGIVAHWMDKVKEKSSTDGSNKHTDKSSSNHRHSHSSSSKSSSNDKTAVSSDKDKVPVHSTSTAKSDSNRDDVDPSRVRTLQDSPDHITAKMNHRALSADRIHTSVVSNDDSTSSSNSVSVDTDNSQALQPPVHRPKTVKIISSKMRSTGLELETPLPPSRKNVSSPSDKDKLVQSTLTFRPQSSSKKVVPDKSPLPGNTTSSKGSTVISSPPPAESNPRIKVVKTRAPEIYESSGFMDALNPTLPVIARRKRKLSTVTSSKTSSAGPVPISPDDKNTSVPAFSHDAMEVNDSTKSQSSDVSAQTLADDKLVPDVAAADTSSISSTSDGIENAAGKESSVSVVQAGEDGSSKDISMEPAIKKKKVKAVTWVEETKLCSFFYFQLDENERVNVNKVQDFAETRKHEQEMERHMMQNVRRMAHDVMSEKRVWRKPFLITGLIHSVIHGCNSKENEIQRERELGVLQVLYFVKSSIPDSAAEPEPEYFELIEPKIIPLSDETGLGSEVIHDSYPVSSLDNNHQSMTVLPADIANLLSAPANQVQNVSAVGSTRPPLLVPHMSPNSSQSQPLPGNVSLPPLHVFLNMPFPNQQHIFAAMPPHIKQQMMNSLPPGLQQQLAPLMSSNGVGSLGPTHGPTAISPDVRPSAPAGILPGPGPFPLMGPSFPRMPGGPGRMPMPLIDQHMNTRRPMRPESGMFPPRLPANTMPMRGVAPPQSRSCRYGNLCRNIHPPREGIPAGGPAIVNQVSPH